MSIKIQSDQLDPSIIRLRYSAGKEFKATTTRFIGPLSLTVAQEAVYYPTLTIIAGSALFGVGTCALEHFGLRFYQSLGENGLVFAMGVVGATGVWVTEVFMGNDILRFVAGKKIRVTITETTLSIGGLMPVSVSREHKLSFAVEALGGVSPIYAGSARLILQIDDGAR